MLMHKRAVRGSVRFVSARIISQSTSCLLLIYAPATRYGSEVGSSISRLWITKLHNTAFLIKNWLLLMDAAAGIDVDGAQNSTRFEIHTNVNNVLHLSVTEIGACNTTSQIL